MCVCISPWRGRYLQALGEQAPHGAWSHSFPPVIDAQLVTHQRVEQGPGNDTVPRQGMVGHTWRVSQIRAQDEWPGLVTANQRLKQPRALTCLRRRWLNSHGVHATRFREDAVWQRNAPPLRAQTHAAGEESIINGENAPRALFRRDCTQSVGLIRLPLALARARRAVCPRAANAPENKTENKTVFAYSGGN